LKKWTIFFVLLLFGFIPAFGEPYMFDTNYVIEKFVSGLNFPITMTFIEDDIFVLEKGGKVRIIENGKLQKDPVLQVNVDYRSEKGLLGITTVDSTVYLYFSESEKSGSDIIANRIYKYTWDGKELQNGVLVKEFPFDSDLVRGQHNGGIMVTDLDDNVYAVVGDARKRGVFQNQDTEKMFDSGVIVHVNYDESVIKPSLSENPQDHFIAMGIRNSFGLAIDPITGYLWDTENGHTDFDEINLVEPKFNSGWTVTMGPASKEQLEKIPGFSNFQYSDPEFTWEQTIAPTAITFVNSESFKEYNENLLVGDFNTGSIFKFKLDSDRTGFIFNDPKLTDLVLDAGDLPFEIIFASGFAGITDLKFGPDGLLYVVSPSGDIFKIIPTSDPKILEMQIPYWIKSNSGWWADKKISDSEFINAIQFLISEGIMVIPSSEYYTLDSKEIPNWIRNNAGWWASDQITDEEFVSGIQFLIKNGIIIITGEKCKNLPDQDVDLSYCNLSGKDFSNLDLKKANLYGADLSFANLANSDLRLANMESVNFTGSKLSKANFQLASLRNSDLSYADLTETSFHFVNLENATFTNSELSDTLFRKSSLKNANFANSRVKVNLQFVLLENANFFGSDLTGSILRASNLTNANFEEADLSKVRLPIAKVTNTNFKGANLSDTYWWTAKLNNADLSFADLSNANFTHANISNSNFTGANLAGADLRTAIIKNVDFSEANMNGCKGCP